MLTGLVVLAAAGLHVPRARADQTVVSAAVYSGSAGSARSASVSLSALAGCPTYSGSSPLYLYPAAQPYQPATDSSWALSTVLTCALQIPLANVHSVQVDNPNLGFESPLSASDLSQPSPFQDPDAYPVISNDGGEDQNTYTRPWRGGADLNAGDQVTNSGPIALVVYENGPPLTVTAAQNVISTATTAEQVLLNATVTQSDGTPVPAAALTWNWSFQDGSGSADAAPTHSFPSGSSIVTLQVTDTATGTGGTASLQVVYQPSPASGGTPRTGAGNHHNGPPAGPKQGTGSTEGGRHHGSGSGAPAGPQTKSAQPRTQNPAPAGSQTPAQTQTNAQTQTPTQTQTQTTVQTQTQTQTQTTTVPATTTTTPAATTRTHPRRGPRRRRQRTPRAASKSAGRLVSGRLVSDVRPVAAGSSPLVRAQAATTASAAAVRRAQSPATVNEIYGALAIILLLWLGARRERAGRRRRAGRPSLHR
jgi:hypothetical protein